MYTSQKKLSQIQEKVYKLGADYPDLYEEVKHVTSLTRQMQVPYMYLADLLTNSHSEAAPKFIRDSVLDVLVSEVNKLKHTPFFNHFLKIIEENPHHGAPEIFLLILGARPEAIVNNAIIK